MFFLRRTGIAVCIIKLAVVHLVRLIAMVIHLDSKNSSRWVGCIATFDRVASVTGRALLRLTCAFLAFRTLCDAVLVSTRRWIRIHTGTYVEQITDAVLCATTTALRARGPCPPIVCFAFRTRRLQRINNVTRGGVNVIGRMDTVLAFSTTLTQCLAHLRLVLAQRAFTARVSDCRPPTALVRSGDAIGACRTVLAGQRCDPVSRTPWVACTLRFGPLMR